jgi:short-subunit dehydrogenase
MAVPYFASFNLTRELLPGMIQKGQGHIVNVTSVASKLIWPGSAAYTATRWAVNGFNEVLRTEVCEQGINVTLAMFGKISSEYWNHNPGSAERLPAITRMVPTITPSQAAQAIISGIEKNKAVVLKPALLRLVLIMNTMFPGNTALIMRKTGWRPNSNIEFSKS